MARKEFKRILESEAYPCKRFRDKAVDHGFNLRPCKTKSVHLRMHHPLIGTNNRLFLEVPNLT